MGFTVVKKKGYSPDEVDAHIQKLTQEYEAKLSEQRSRIFEMKEKTAQLEKELEESRSHYSLINKTLIEAVKRAEEIDSLCASRYREEIQHLQVFHDKWVKYYSRLIQKYPADEDLRSVREFNNKMRDILNGKTAERLELERVFDTEFRRITRLDKKRAEEIVEVVDAPVRKPAAKKKESAFNFEEALNPKEGLDQILKDLGIYEGEQ